MGEIWSKKCEGVGITCPGAPVLGLQQPASELVASVLHGGLARAREIQVPGEHSRHDGSNYSNNSQKTIFQNGKNC